MGASGRRPPCRVLQLSGLSDPVYVEAAVTVHQYDIVMDVTLINRYASLLVWLLGGACQCGYALLASTPSLPSSLPRMPRLLHTPAHALTGCPSVQTTKHIPVPSPHTLHCQDLGDAAQLWP